MQEDHALRAHLKEPRAGTGQMAQQLRAHAALLEDPGSVPNSNVVVHN